MSSKITIKYTKNTQIMDKYVDLKNLFEKIPELKKVNL